jgi:hypothetical protein
MGLWVLPAHANDFLVQVDDSTDHMDIRTYENGTLIQGGFDLGEAYLGGYALGFDPNAGLLSDIDVRYNILELNGQLSDTWHIFGTEGDDSLSIPFISDSEGGGSLTPLDGGITVFETGGWQTVLVNTVANLDTFTWQFRSDVSEVPLPGALPLLAAGLGALGVVGRWRGKHNPATPHADA